MIIDIDKVRKSICSKYEFEEYGINRYLIHTDMYYDDGDELHIVLMEDSGQYTLTDEGHTIMWLSYDLNLTPNKEGMMESIVSKNNVSLNDGRLYVSFFDLDEFGNALTSLIQSMLQIADLRILNRNNVVKTFLEDIRNAYRNSPLADICVFSKEINLGNSETMTPDVYIDCKEPILVFGVHNSSRAKEVIINLMAAKESNLDFRTVVVIAENSNIPKKDYKRLVNRSTRPVIGTNDVVDLTEELLASIS